MEATHWLMEPTRCVDARCTNPFQEEHYRERESSDDPGASTGIVVHRCDSLHPSLAPCSVLLGDTPHPCETTGPKIETVHGSGPIVHARL